MPVANPKKSISAQKMKCGDTAAVTLSFDTAAELANDPADIILIMDRSSSMTQDRLNYAKAAAHQLIDIIEAASNDLGNGQIHDSRMGIASFADAATADVPLTGDTAALHAAIDALSRGGLTNHRAAFDTAETMLTTPTDNRQILVMFTDGKTTTGGSADATTAAIKAAGIEIFCIGLVDDPTPLQLWATDPDSEHVAYTDDPAQLDRVFREIAAEIVEAGARDAIIREQLSPDFKILAVDPPAYGTVQVVDSQTLIWSIDGAGLNNQPDTISLTFTVMNTGTASGTVSVNQSAAYEDRDGNTLTFPDPQVEIDCNGAVIYPETCPVPTALLVPGCKDSAQVNLDSTKLQSLGRIVQVDVTVRNVCPGKRVAVAVMLTEYGPNGEEYARGTKAFTIPALVGEACQDVSLRCIHFVVPEDLDPAEDPHTICNARQFNARVMANYVDTDFVCCDADAVIL